MISFRSFLVRMSRLAKPRATTLAVRRFTPPTASKLYLGKQTEAKIKFDNKGFKTMYSIPTKLDIAALTWPLQTPLLLLGSQTQSFHRDHQLPGLPLPLWCTSHGPLHPVTWEVDIINTFQIYIPLVQWLDFTNTSTYKSLLCRLNIFFVFLAFLQT